MWWEAGASNVVFGVVEREMRDCNVVVVPVWVFNSNRRTGYDLLDALGGWVVCKVVDGREASNFVLRVVERETRSIVLLEWWRERPDEASFCWSGGERDQMKHRFVI